jgi:mannose-6-phosphate isomerase-like protein (cupin superfamily)
MDVKQYSQLDSFVTKDGSIIRELLSHRNSGIRNQSLAEARVPPGIRTQPHYHPVSEEIYYILSGDAHLFLDEEMRLVGPGDAIAIPPGRIHSIENISTTELIFLCCCAPGYEHEDTILVS